MGSLNLVVPLVMWGREAPTHDISCILLTPDVHSVVTGSRDGQICVWDFDPPNLKLTPRCLLVGHTAAVTCLAQGGKAHGTSFIVSSSENGEMCVWDLRDGQCVEMRRSANLHTSMKAYQMLNVSDVRLFCCGNYPEILVYDPQSLDILFSLAARIQPDWISALHILRPPRRNDEVVLGVTTGGWVKVWTVSEREVRPREPIFEHESKMVHSLNALGLVCCTYNQRTVLMVSQEDWQIYDAGDFSQLCRVCGKAGERWMGGDFLSADRVIVWTDMGRAYIYKLPTKCLRGKAVSCIVESRAFHNKQMEGDNPILYGVVRPQSEEQLVNAPAWQFMTIPLESGAEKLLLRGDCEGQVMLWRLADVSDNQLRQINQVHPFQPLLFPPTLTHSMVKAWGAMVPPPIGILDQLEGERGPPRITASLFLPLQGRLACGREDGSIILVPATEAIMLHLLHGKHHHYHNWAQPMVLRGHQGRVNCLLYPHGESPHYDMAHLVSGGIDFSINVWDMYTGNLVHRFVVQAGQVLQLLVPPPTCTTRIQYCICSVSEDHSVALLSLKERKLVLLASKHLYPVASVKWRPDHDFLLVATQDGSVYVWQMETGHLDRVLQGVTAEEVLGACDEHVAGHGGGASAGADSETGLANPAVHLFRGLRHRNLAAIRHAAQRGIQQVLGEQNNHQDIHDSSKMRTCPLMIQGLRTNKQDANSHVLFFDIEALIVQLLSDEYTLMSPGTLEANELIMSSQYQRMNDLTHPASPEAAKKIAEFFGKVKDKAGEMEKKMKEKDKHDILGRAKDKAVHMEKRLKERDQQGLLSRVKESAESVQNMIQNKVDQSGFRPTSLSSGKDGEGGGRVQLPRHLDVTAQTLQIGQMVMSLLHSWGLDTSLDHICEHTLGLLKPRVPVSYGLISKSGYMSLFMPTWHPVREADMPNINLPPDLAAELPPEMVRLEHRTQVFTARGHWEVSPALTTHHLLALVSVANTLQDMNAATLIPEQERRRKNHIQSSKGSSQTGQQQEDEFSRQQSVIKQGWSTLTALHTVLLPDCVLAAGAPAYQPPMVEILARRWQDRCQEVREAAQALLKTELSRMGPAGRQKLIELWSPNLPSHTEPLPAHTTSQPHHHEPPPRPDHPKTTLTNATSNATTNGTPSNPSTGGGSGSGGGGGGGGQGGTERGIEAHPHLDDEHYDEEMDGETCRELVAQSEGRRKQATAIILLGVIGAYHGQDSAEGFGLGNLAMMTSKALAYRVLAPPNNKLPASAPLRRAAIDLIGRGFPVWEPYLEVAKVLLALLDYCADTDRLAPSMKYGLPLIPEADSCRTASNALTLIAEARPPAFITTMAREVARFNALQQNAQSLQLNIHANVLYRAKTEILRVMEYLILHKRSFIMDLMVEVMDIVLHCLDPGHLKSRGLSEVFPSICSFPQVSHCPHTRRIATGAKTGTIAMYELRLNKCQMIPAHSSMVTALSFSPDGKYLASYSMAENKLSFWQTSSGMFGLGSSQTKCTKTFSTVPVPDIVRLNPQRLPKLVWVSNKSVIHMMADGTEHRFNA